MVQKTFLDLNSLEHKITIGSQTINRGNSGIELEEDMHNNMGCSRLMNMVENYTITSSGDTRSTRIQINVAEHTAYEGLFVQFSTGS